jgi:hypothetical protein
MCTPFPFASPHLPGPPPFPFPKAGEVTAVLVLDCFYVPVFFISPPPAPASSPRVDYNPTLTDLVTAVLILDWTHAPVYTIHPLHRHPKAGDELQSWFLSVPMYMYTPSPPPASPPHAGNKPTLADLVTAILVLDCIFVPVFTIPIASPPH